MSKSKDKKIKPITLSYSSINDNKKVHLKIKIYNRELDSEENKNEILEYKN